jgi:hypothetical protein
LAYICPINEQQHAMNTTITNKDKVGKRGYFLYAMNGYECTLFFAVYSYGDGELQFLSKSYRTQKGADKYLTEYRKQANA